MQDHQGNRAHISGCVQGPLPTPQPKLPNSTPGNLEPSGPDPWGWAACSLALVPAQGGCAFSLPTQPLGDWLRVLQTAWTDNSDLNTPGALAGAGQGGGEGERS